jgi:hypothetical protein
MTTTTTTKMTTKTTTKTTKTTRQETRWGVYHYNDDEESDGGDSDDFSSWREPLYLSVQRVL